MNLGIPQRQASAKQAFYYFPLKQKVIKALFNLKQLLNGAGSNGIS